MSKETQWRLPLTQEELPTDLPPPTRAALATLNEEFLRNKASLKTLEQDKGILSRQIGQAKKQGLPIDELLAGVQQFSSRIDELKQKQQQLQEQAIALLTPPAPEAPTLPGHFLPRQHLSDATAASIGLIEHSQLAEWDAYVDQHPHACVYHRSAFKAIIEQAFGHTTHYLTARDAAGNICGILPAIHLRSALFGSYFVSVPFFNYGGALGDNPAIETALMAHLQQRATDAGARHVEYRDTQPRPGLPQKTEKNALLLQLPDSASQLWEDIGSKVRAQIKKAESFGLSFRSGGIELLDDFYKVFATNMRDLGTPVYGKDFFRHILDQGDLASILCVAYDAGRPVSCAFLLGYRNGLEIPWASTVREANRSNANMFLYWNVLSLAIARGYRFFDFGRSSKDAGTFKFKLQWGAQPQQLYWHYWLRDGGDLPALNPNNPKYRLVIGVWQRLPVWLTVLLGPHIVKNLP